MYLLKKLILSLVLPPTGPLLLALAGILLMRHRPRTGRLLTGFSLFVLLTLSTPWAAGYLLASLQRFSPITDAQLKACQAIVVLGGGIYRHAPEYGGDTIGYVSLERLRYAIHLSKRSGLPILATGGAPEGGLAEAQTMSASAKEDFATQVRWTESGSYNTADSARLSASILKNNNVHRIALVSHSWHLPRAVALFVAADLDVVPAPTAFSLPPTDASALLPNASALATSSRALHEWLGIMAVRLGAS